MKSLRESLVELQSKYQGTIAGGVLAKQIAAYESGFSLSLYEVTSEMERTFEATREGTTDHEQAEQAWNDLMDMRVKVSSEHVSVDLNISRREMVYAGH